MNTKTLILLALICPMIWGANMLAKKCASTETGAQSDGTGSFSRTNDVSQEIADDSAPAEPRTRIGVVVPATIVDVRCQISGVIDSLSKSVGDSVNASQPLATLDNAEMLL